jgi:hypothetical protein
MPRLIHSNRFHLDFHFAPCGSKWSALGFFVVLFFSGFSMHAQQTVRARTLIVIFDGLRPDYVTPENMPNVYALKEGGSYALDNHSVFPTVTRVNASSYATGSYPNKHGLLGNTVYFPEVDKTRGLNTGDVEELMRINDGTGSKLLTSVSFGELLQRAGSELMVFSSGSSGQAFLQNHTVSGRGLIHPDVTLPASLKVDVIRTLGSPPASAKPNTAQHEWATRALLQYGLVKDGPAVCAIWLSDPDGTAHSDGIGSPSTMQSIKVVDHLFGIIMKALTDNELLSVFNIIITADHGFVTEVGTESVSDFLVKKGFKRATSSDDVVVAGNALYVKGRDGSNIKKIVSALQREEWVGAIFTKSARRNSLKGWVDGTLSFKAIHWDHESRAADILVDYQWDKTKNSYGFEGSSFANGIAGHGGSSPYEIHIPLICSGPGFKKEYRSSAPTSNVDIIPTVLHLHGIANAAHMDGRVMTELLSGFSGNSHSKPRKEIVKAKAKHAWGKYSVMLERSIFNKRKYVDFTVTERNLN